MIDDVAARYADAFTSPEGLARLARARLAQRVRRASHGACAICGRPLWGRADEVTCSASCRAKKYRQDHAESV